MASLPPLPETQQITLSDSRILSYGIYGVATPGPATLTIFYFHGFPASHYEAIPFHAAAHARDVRLVAIDRPGMNLSTFQRDRTLLDWPTDVLALADHPSIAAPKFAVLGMSGGGPYALACCRAIPKERLLAAGVLAGLYPCKFGLRGMLIETRALLFIAPWATGLIAKLFDTAMGPLVKDTDHPERLENATARTMKGRPKKDRELYFGNEVMRESMHASVRASMGVPEGGARGAAWEARLYGNDWGFELEEIKMDEGKLVLWHGTADVNSPAAMAEKAVVLIEGAELRRSEGETHVSLFMGKIEEALDTLKERAV